MRPGETPVPIPNTMVKTRAAESTALETVWEDRWLPDFENLLSVVRVRVLREVSSKVVLRRLAKAS